MIINNVKYKVIPIGINTTTPAIKLFLNEENADLLVFFLVINLNA